MNNNRYTSLICFSLLNDTNQESYINVFRIINNYCSTCTKRFDVKKKKKMYIDIEIAIHNAIHDIWSLNDIRACQFRLDQS